MDKIDLNQVLLDDLASSYPTELTKLSLHRWVVPKDLGGELGSIEELLVRGRWLSRHNVTAAIALGQCFLGSLPVWIAGREEQKKLMALKLLKGENSCLALTEKKHGSDLSHTECFYRDEKLSGEKWCINNATIGTSMSVLVNTEKGLTLLLVDKESTGNFKYLPKIKTHGIRGADISGIIFDESPISEDMIISRYGKGLDTVAKTLQVSRTLCSAFSLGAFEACLEMVKDFMQSRVLYGEKLANIDAPKQLFNLAQKKFEVCESLGLIMARGVTFNPEMMSLYSAVTKYLVPKLASEGIEILGEILGARGYINEEEYPLFEKMKRDHSVVPLFDGSSAVNLSIISGQMSNIKRHLDQPSQDWDVFDLSKKAPDFSGKNYKLSNRGNDFIFSQYRGKDATLNNQLDIFRDELKLELDSFSYAARKRSDHYCRIVAGICQYELQGEVSLELFNKSY